jgi:hypothetical protein
LPEVLPESKPIHLPNILLVPLRLVANESWHRNKRFSCTNDDRLLQIDPAIVAHRCGSQQTEPLACCWVELDDRDMTTLLDAFKVKAMNDPVFGEAAGEPGVGKGAAC